MAANDRRNSVLSIGSARAVTADDNNDLPGGATRALLIGGAAGNVAVIFADDDTAVTLTGLAVGVWHPISVKRVLSTGTTAGGIFVGR
jgi:hypothetical protein